jgi:hypothetical protein
MEPLRNHGGSAFSNFQSAEGRFPDPGGAAGVVRRAKPAAGGAAEIIDQHKVILRRTGTIGYDSFEDFEHTDNVDFEPGLLKHFAAQRGFQEFTGFDDAAGQRPPVFQRLVPAFDE